MKSECSSLEPRVRLVGLGLLVGGPFARVLHRQGGDDDEHLAGAAELAGLDEHPAQPRVHGQPGQRRPVCREPAPSAPPPTARAVPRSGRRGRRLPASRRRRPGCRRPAAPRAGARRRRPGAASGASTNGKRGDVAEAERGHLEDDRGEAGALDLGLGELGPRVVVLLGVEPDADAVGEAAAAAGALVGAGLRDRLDRQPLHLGALGVARDARGAGVDDVPDAGDGQRRLGDVGGQHDPSSGGPAEDAGAAPRRRAARRAGAPRSAGASSTSSASAVSRISRSPERNTRMS